MQSALAREYRKMYRNLNGMRTLKRRPACLVIIDPKKEKTAVLEARKLGVPVVALIDTDCNPDVVDLPIPGNDDGIRSIEIIMKHLADAVLAGAQRVAATQKKAASSEAVEREPVGAAAE
jgi:small subunit ribosomal protein S2